MNRLKSSVSNDLCQGRRHGFENGEKFCERSEQKIFFDPPLFGQWVRQTIA